MKKEDLLNLINDDDLGILSIKQVSASVTTDERLVASFLEINNFVEFNKREPQAGGNISEHQLASRLAGLRADQDKIEKLLDFDEYNLLDTKIKETKSIADIFNDEDFAILDNTDEKIFDLRNVPNRKERVNPGFVARRKPCIDFPKFEPLFASCQKNLKTGHFKLLRLEKHNQLREGTFFVSGGVLGLIEKTYQFEINDQKKLDGRLRVIFENGTESNMLLQSLIKALQDQDGWFVLDHDTLVDSLPSLQDSHTGYIYIVKSLSDNPKISSLNNLFKIGFSTTPVEERVKDAAQDPTYLMAPVKIVSTFECYNFNPQKLEQLLHNFFGSACLDIDIFDANNKRLTPREWFIAPLEIIEKSIELIINGEVLNFKYDSKNQKIILR